VKARQIAAYVQIEAGDRDGTLDALRELMALTPPVKQPYMQAAQLLARIDEPAERLALMQEAGRRRRRQRRRPVRARHPRGGGR
jgi:hypothetical protein